MKKLKYFIILFIFFLIPSKSFASASGDAVYQTIINYMVANYGSDYSTYLQNKHCVLLDVSQIPCNWWVSYPIKSTNQMYYYNDNRPYELYVALFGKNEPMLTISDILQQQDGIDYNQILDCNPNQGGRNQFFIYCLYSDGSIRRFDSVDYKTYFNTGVSIIYNDDTIYTFDNQGNAVGSITSSNYNLNPAQVEITGNETQSELYQKCMAWFNANANYYANVWSEGPKPSVLILDNRNRDIVANLYNNNNVAPYDFIVCLSPDRFCAYEQNSNSYHYNFLTYQQRQFWYLLVDIGTSNNISFYRYSINSQMDCATVTSNADNRIFFCNSNILKKYNANNFILNNAGAIENFYTSIMENVPTYPINPNNGSSGGNGGNGSVWTSDDIVGFKEAIDDIYSTNDLSITDILTNAISSITNLTPLHFISDFFSDLYNCYQTALVKVNTTSLSWNITLFGTTIRFAPFDFLLNNQNLYMPFLHVSLFINLIFYIFTECKNFFKGD